VLLIDDDEREVFADLLNQLEALVSDPNNPAVRRLFPAAYVNDPERNNEYARLMHEELTASKIAAITTARSVLTSPDPMSEDGLIAFMQVVNSLRLVLGTLLDVDEGNDLLPDANEPNAASWHLYTYLGWLLEWIVEELGSQL
jgi:hypothetical protein